MILQYFDFVTVFSVHLMAVCSLRTPLFGGVDGGQYESCTSPCFSVVCHFPFACPQYGRI